VLPALGKAVPEAEPVHHVCVIRQREGQVQKTPKRSLPR
jgi:hypothetical protein